MKILPILLLLMILAACGVGDSFTEMQQQTALASEALLKEVGSRPQIGWNIYNGTLANVTVVFPDDKVSQLSISELSAKVQLALANNLKEQPQQIVLSVVIKR
jgi:hypothetical protein